MPQTTAGRLDEVAPAKVNLTLRVRGRRLDGFHEIESLVVFAGEGDRLSLHPGEALSLQVSGATAKAAGPEDDNLVLRAARHLAEALPGLRAGRFALEKRLPVAAGLGGGSSDAAAALRLLANFNGLPPDDARVIAAARATGADVPVCLDPKARVMRGIGEVLSPSLSLPLLHAVLVNPGVAVPTRDVFARLDHKPGDMAEADERTVPTNSVGLDAYLRSTGNDLEAPALAVAPVIAEVLAMLRGSDGCTLARMSGSGATCFGLFENEESTEAAASALSAERPNWWCRATTLR